MANLRSWWRRVTWRRQPKCPRGCPRMGIVTYKEAVEKGWKWRYCLDAPVHTRRCDCSEGWPYKTRACRNARPVEEEI